MANVRGLYEDQSGQRWAWNGYDYVKVGKGFDPRKSPFVAGVGGAVRDIGAGVQQMIAGFQGDDLALEGLAQEVGQRRQEQAILARQNPLAYAAGQMLPFAAGAGVGGAVGGAARGALGAWAGATGADMALGAATYGTPGERAGNIAMAAGAGALGLGAGYMLRGLRPRGPGTAAQRATAPAGGRNLGASGRVTDIQDPAQVSLAARLAGRMMSVGRYDLDQARLRQTARARALADQYDVTLTPAMRSGSLAMEQVEAGLMSNPWSAAPGQRVVNKFKGQLEQATKDFLLPGYEGPVDEDFFRALTDDLNRGFREVVENSDAIKTNEVLRRAQRITAESQERAWGPKEHKLFNDQLNEIQKFGKTMQPEAAWTKAQAMAKEAARRFDSSGRYQEGIAYQSIADAIEESIVRGARGKVDPQDLDILRKRYRVKLALEKAGGAKGREGMPMATTYNRLADMFPSELGEGRGFEQNYLSPLNRMFDHWTIANKLFRPVVGDSGTATRLSTADVTPAGIGANALRGLAAAMYYNEPTMAFRPAAGAAALGATGGAILD